MAVVPTLGAWIGVEDSGCPPFHILQCNLFHVPLQYRTVFITRAIAAACATVHAIADSQPVVATVGGGLVGYFNFYEIRAVTSTHALCFCKNSFYLLQRTTTCLAEG